APSAAGYPDFRRVYVRVRVTDTGGNVTVSPVAGIHSLPDLFAPVYYPRSFTDGSVRSAGLAELPLYFSEALHRVTITTDNFQVQNAQGQVVPGLSVELGSGDRTVIVRFDPLAVGSYKLVINAANVTDRAGNRVAADPIVTRFQTVTPTTNVWIGSKPGV